MNLATIYNRNTGISVLEQKFNIKLNYTTDEIYYLKNNTVFIEETKDINIFTDIDNLSDLNLLVKELKQTDIYEMFNEHIIIHPAFNTYEKYLVNDDYMIIDGTTTSYAGTKPEIIEKSITVFVNVKNI